MFEYIVIFQYNKCSSPLKLVIQLTMPNKYYRSDTVFLVTQSQYGLCLTNKQWCRG